MKTATIEFSASLVVREDGDEWEGGEMTPEDAAGWVSHALSRGDKHAGNYSAYGGRPVSVTYEDAPDDE